MDPDPTIAILWKGLVTIPPLSAQPQGLRISNDHLDGTEGDAPAPSAFMRRRALSASASPWSAALRYHFAASALSLGRPSPSAYMRPRAVWASARPWSAALRYHFTVSALSMGTPSPLRNRRPRAAWASARP